MIRDFSIRLSKKIRDGILLYSYKRAVKKQVYRVKTLRQYAEHHGHVLCDSNTIKEHLRQFEKIDEIDIVWRDSVSHPNAYIAELKRAALLTQTSYMLTRDGSWFGDELSESMHQFGVRSKLWDMEVADDGAVSKMPEFEFSDKVLESGLVLMAEHETNYFHWLVEMLPRLFLYERLIQERDIPLLVTDSLHQNLYDLLDLVRDPRRPLIKLKKRTLYPVMRMVIPPLVARIVNVYDRLHDMDTVYVPVGLLTMMVSEVKKKNVYQDEHLPKRIYVKRSSIYRHVLNQEEVEAVLVAQGFVVIDPGVMTIKEQINYYANAEMIVGPSGASMANMLWCSPGAKILIFHSHQPNKKYPYWDALARVSGVNLTYLYGERAFNVTGYFEAHDDYRVDVNRLMYAVSTL